MVTRRKRAHFDEVIACVSMVKIIDVTKATLELCRVADKASVASSSPSGMDGILLAAQAVRLLGAQVVLTGIRPAVARRLIALGSTLHGIMTCSTLQAGSVHAMRDGGGAKRQR